MSQDKVRAYYQSFDIREWERLTWPEGQLEYRITQSALNRHLPPAGRVLDLGGGAGRWTLWLAERGYSVTLADLSPNLLAIAHDKVVATAVAANVKEIVTADACDLSRWPDNSFDAVLCLGPFYHLVSKNDREAAAEEIIRVMKPGGVLYCAYMPIYGFLRRTLALKDELRHLSDPKFVDQLVSEGKFVNDIDGRFNAGYGVRPDEIEPFWSQRGVKIEELLSDSGFAASNANDIAELAMSDAAAYERVMSIVEASAKDPSCLGSAVHLLFIGRKSH